MAKDTKSRKDAGAAKQAPVYLVVGTDEYCVSDEAHRIVHALCPPDRQALGLEIVEAQVENAAAAVEAIRRCVEGLRTVGFFGGRKVVWLRSANFFSDTAVGKAADTKAAVEVLTAEIKAGLAKEQCLVVSAAKVDRRSAFYKACEAAGKVSVYDVPEKSYQAEQQARERAQKELRQAGLRADQQVIDYFVTRAGTGTRQILQEVEKLSLYLGRGAEVRKEDVDAVVSPSREAIWWDFTDHVGRRELPEALTTLRQLLGQKDSAVHLVIALESRFRDLTVLRTCLDRGWLRIATRGNWKSAEWVGGDEMEAVLQELQPDPRKVNAYRVTLLAAQAQNFRPEELVRCRRRVMETHERLVSTSLPEDLLMEVLVTDLLGRQAKA